MREMILILCCIAVVITHHRSVEGNVQGSPISSLSPRPLLAGADATSCTNLLGPICGDCSTLLTCLGGSTPYRTQICEKTYPGEPYCVDGGCTSVPDPNDKTCSRSGITCTGLGYFPNPLNCSQYYFCEGRQGASKFYECPPNFVYNSQAKICKRRTRPSDCSIINCDSSSEEYVPYPGDPSLYALCAVTDDTATPVVFKCLGYEQFVTAKHRCVFQCNKEGRFADGRDCMKYYDCYRNGLSYITYHETCPTGFLFSTEENGCVAGTCAGNEDAGSEAGDIGG